MTTYYNATPQGRLKWALARLRSEGIRARFNVAGCCRSCIQAARPEDDDERWVWHYGGQGGRIVWDDEGRAWSGDPDHWRSRRYGTAWFNHDDIEAAERAVLAFALAGFRVDWDRTSSRSIGVDLDSIPEGADAP